MKKGLRIAVAAVVEWLGLIELSAVRTRHRARARTAAHHAGWPGLILAQLWVIVATVAAPAQSPAPPTATRAAPADNYILAPLDRLTVAVFQEPDMTTDARVSNDGTILVPLIGKVRVAGGSVHDAAQAIRLKLKKGYFVDPQVTITVTDFSRRRFTVIGQVQHGGTFNLPDQSTLDLLQAIGIAGGYTKIANPGKVTVQRKTDGKAATFKLNAKAMAEGKDQPFEILPGDIITVGESIF